MLCDLLTSSQIDISDDGFLSLMTDDGVTKDDVKLPEGEIGERITKLFKVEEKDTSKFHPPRTFSPPFGTLLASPLENANISA